MPVILNTDPERRLAEDVVKATERLMVRFAGQVDEPTVHRVVAEAASSLSEARIKDFLGIIVERVSRERLRAMALPG